MIDRGALIVAWVDGRAYRGVHRPPLDAQSFTGRRGRDIARRYSDAIVAGEGVLEDLDEALSMRDAARKIGLTTLETIVFEQTRDAPRGVRSLAVAPTPPAEGLRLLGYDIIEAIEPFWSPLAEPKPGVMVNAHGLLDTLVGAVTVCTSLESAERDDPLIVVRVWLAD